MARLTPYRTRPDGVGALIDEVVAIAHARPRPWEREPGRRAEFLLVSRSRGDVLSLVVGDDPTVRAVVEPGLPPSGDPEEYDVALLQVGGPRTSGVVERLVARLVRCDPDAARDLSFDGRAVPASPDVWTRALLVASDGRVVAFAVGSDVDAVAESLATLAARSTRVEDYDDAVYHFFVDDRPPES